MSVLGPPRHGGDSKRLSWGDLQRVHGVTQGHQLYPTIFNTIVDAVFRQLVKEVDGEETGLDGFERAVGQTSTFFYADDGLLASTRAERIQR